MMHCHSNPHTSHKKPERLIQNTKIHMGPILSRIFLSAFPRYRVSYRIEEFEHRQNVHTFSFYGEEVASWAQ